MRDILELSDAVHLITQIAFASSNDSQEIEHQPQNGFNTADRTPRINSRTYTAILFSVFFFYLSMRCEIYDDCRL